MNMAIKEGASEKYDVLLGNLEKALSQVLESIRAIEQGADEQVGG